MNSTLLVLLYSIAVVAASLFGGWLPSLFYLTHVRMQMVLSFVGGMMLGVGLLHMLPHSYVELGSLDLALVWMLVGLLGMFLLIRMFHFHEHGPVAHDVGDDQVGGAADVQTDRSIGETTGHRHREAGAHDHGPGECAHGPTAPLSSISWIGIAIGLSLHAFLDGIALGAGVISDTVHRGGPRWAGFGVFLAVLLHKPLDALSITTVMQARGWSRRAQQAINAGIAMMCPIGALGFASWVQQAGTAQHRLVGIALAVSAGVFLCISLSDLLPEVQFHRHDRLKLSAALIFGVLCAYGIRYFEPPHAHGPAHESHGAVPLGGEHTHDDGSVHDH